MKRFLMIIAVSLMAIACYDDEFKLMVYESEDAYFELDPHLTSMYFHVATNKSFTMSSDESWIPVGKDSRGHENSWVRLNFEANMTGSDREGYVNFTSDNIDNIQTLQVRFLQKPYYYFNLGAEGGSIEIPMRDVPIDTYYVSSGEEWLSCSTEKEVKKVFIISASENTSSEERIGYVYCKYKDQYVYVYPFKQAKGGSSSEQEPEQGTEHALFGEPANCYIVSEGGRYYAFYTTRGNSGEYIDGIASAEVLWESDGTANAEQKAGDLINNVSYIKGYNYVSFFATEGKGNAVIAVKDASGKILWSWHIWLTDQPQDQKYNNGSYVMDRNLGATSATPGDAGALGLLYQWGRKDPFLGSVFISENAQAYSTLAWPKPVASFDVKADIEYAVANPTTFITYNDDNYDWYYTGNDEIDNTRWQSEKTIYDPCPAGYRVPDGGKKGLWSDSFDTYKLFTGVFNGDNKGFDFCAAAQEPSFSLIHTDSPCWYPAAGYLYNDTLCDVGDSGNYWSCSHDSTDTAGLILQFDKTGYVNPWYPVIRAIGNSVRCVRE